MSMTTMVVDCGPLGEIEWTISYRYWPGFKGTQFEPSESENAHINWIKIGGYKGVEVFPSDDYITDEVVPHCLADYHGIMEEAAERKAYEMREERRLACG